MKTVTLGWLLRKTPTPSLAWSSNKYQYYYCPNNADNPFGDGGHMVKIKRDYVIKQNRERWPSDSTL